MNHWKPKIATGLWVGLGLLLLTGAGISFLAFSFVQAFRQPPAQWPINLMLYSELLMLFGLLLLEGLLIYYVSSAFTLRYEIDRNGIYIFWLDNQVIIPISQIEKIESDVEGAKFKWQPMHFLGYLWGQGYTHEGKRLSLFTSCPVSQSLLIHTPTEVYAISPAQLTAFVQNLEQRRRLGIVKPLTPSRKAGHLIFHAYWNDRLLRWALLLTFGLNLLFLGLLAARYPSLAANIEMHFDVVGKTTEFRPRHQTLFLPLAAFLLSLLNTGLAMLTYQNIRIGAQLLQLASILLQVLFGIALLTIILH